MDSIKIGIFEFVWYFICTLSINAVIARLNKKYGVRDFEVDILWKRLFIRQTKEGVRDALRKDAKGDFTWANYNFFAAHGHPYGIGNIPTSNPLWTPIHTALQRSIDTGRMENIMEKNQGILFGKYGFRYNMNTVLREFIMTIWAQYCFGEQVNVTKYAATYDRIIGVLRCNFYDAWLRSVPILGWLNGQVWRTYNDSHLAWIDCEIQNMYIERNSFFHKVREELTANVGAKLANDILHDNMFLSFLIFDFLYVFLCDVLINKASQRPLDKEAILKNAFLFPLRLRQFPDGNYALVNLTESGNFFSYGQRGCIAPALVGRIHQIFVGWFKDINVCICNLDALQRMNDPNVPLITSQHIMDIDYPRYYLKSNLRSYQFKGITFRDVTSINENPALFNYIIYEMTRYINRFGGIDVIISPEARGWLYAAPIAAKLGIPLVVLRRPGKLPGETRSISYKKNYEAEKDALEMSAYSKIAGKCGVIVDDGVAGGTSIQAAYDLVTGEVNGKPGCQILGVIAAIQHTYRECTFTAKHIYSVFEM